MQDQLVPHYNVTVTVRVKAQAIGHGKLLAKPDSALILQRFMQQFVDKIVQVVYWAAEGKKKYARLIIPEEAVIKLAVEFQDDRGDSVTYHNDQMCWENVIELAKALRDKP